MNPWLKDLLASLIATFYYIFVGALSIFVYLDRQNIFSPYSGRPPIFYQTLLFIALIITAFFIFRVIKTGRAYRLMGRAGAGGIGICLRDTNRTGFNILLGIRIFIALLAIMGIIMMSFPPAMSQTDEQIKMLENQLTQQASGT